MARARDYKREYALRQQRARSEGFSSYWQRRQTRRLAYELYPGESTNRQRIPGQPRNPAEQRARFIKRIAEPPRGMTAAQARSLWLRGMDAQRSHDWDEAERIARRLGYRASAYGPARRIWWYH